jgi:prephenate dehydrogenase
VRNSEIVVVAVPMAVVSSLPKDLLHDAPAHLIVIDTSTIIRGSGMASSSRSRRG